MPPPTPSNPAINPEMVAAIDKTVTKAKRSFKEIESNT